MLWHKEKASAEQAAREAHPYARVTKRRKRDSLGGLADDQSTNVSFHVFGDIAADVRQGSAQLVA
jgi:hypothetical protein